MFLALHAMGNTFYSLGDAIRSAMFLAINSAVHQSIEATMQPSERASERVTDQLRPTALKEPMPSVP